MPAVGLVPLIVTPFSVFAVDPAVGPFALTVCALAPAAKTQGAHSKISPNFRPTMRDIRFLLGLKL
jgi:hypothetical protein